MRRIRRLAALAIVCSFAAACSREAPPEITAEPAPATQAPVDLGLAAIEAGRIKTHLEFLAADARKGRMTGTPEYDEAADYVAQQFAAIGLEPGGEDGGWFQPVPMLANRIDVESATVVFHQEDEEQVQRFRDDFVMGGDAVRPDTEIRAEVVFVGFGIHAPDMNY